MARKGRKPEEVAKPSWRGEVPHGQGISIADAVRLALRNNRELPDARPNHPGVPAGSGGGSLPADCEHRVPAAGARARNRVSDAVAGTESRAGDGRAVPTLPDEADPRPGQCPGHGRVPTLTTAADELRDRRRLRHLPLLRVGVLPVVLFDAPFRRQSASASHCSQWILRG